MKRISNFISVIMALLFFSMAAFAQGRAATVIVEKVVVAEISDTTPLIAR